MGWMEEECGHKDHDECCGHVEGDDGRDLEGVWVDSWTHYCDHRSLAQRSVRVLRETKSLDFGYVRSKSEIDDECPNWGA